ncbi:MAG: hypothetical protein Q9190_004218 [Brigantiaea leucoxantha]
MSSSPFYALHDLFAFAVASESQLINFLTAPLRIETAHWTRNPDAMNSVLESLQRHKVMMVAHRKQMSTTLDVSDARQASSPLQSKVHSSRRPTLNSNSSNNAQVSMEDTTTDVVAAQLRSDYEDILERTDALIRAYSEGMEDIHKLAILLESRKAIEQAKGVARLTLLAFLFIPLSFTT